MIDPLKSASISTRHKIHWHSTKYLPITYLSSTILIRYQPIKDQPSSILKYLLEPSNYFYPIGVAFIQN